MAELSGLQIFKYLPAAKKTEFSNCKKCGCPTCMAFALKLAKKQASINSCEYIPLELKNVLEYSNKESQKIVDINGLKIGGENVLFRHEKTFINKTGISVIVDLFNPKWKEELQRIQNFEITRVNETLKVDLIVFKGNKTDEVLNLVKENLNYIWEEDLLKLPLEFVLDENFKNTVETLTSIRQKAIFYKDEACSNPVCVFMNGGDNYEEFCARASYYICKYANLIVLPYFDEALISTLMILRQNIFTDPQKPLQVESKIYEFNSPNENSLIFLTTNFALTFFAVANELESLKESSYLIVTPADGMSVLTAWSAEKFTAKMVVKMLKSQNISEKVRTRDIIIPGLLAHMKEELEEEFKLAGLDFNIVIGTIEAFAIQDFVKEYTSKKNIS